MRFHGVSHKTAFMSGVPYLSSRQAASSQWIDMGSGFEHLTVNVSQVAELIFTVATGASQPEVLANRSALNMRFDPTACGDSAVAWATTAGVGVGDVTVATGTATVPEALAGEPALVVSETCSTAGIACAGGGARGAV
jgi:hypothetical protein